MASNGDAFASSILAATRNPRKPPTPITVTAKSAAIADLDLARLPIRRLRSQNEDDDRCAVGFRVVAKAQKIVVL
jgi:hypothetical protein